MRLRRLWVAAFVSFGLSGAALAEDAVSFKGVRIELSVGYVSGSANDLTSRLVAEYLGRFIPGNPTILVVNMPGASGIIQTNYMANTAVKNGLAIGYVGRESAYQQLAAQPGVRFDLSKFRWIGGLSQKGMIVFVHRRAKIAAFQQWRQSKTPILFAVRAVEGADYLAAKAIEALGAPVKIVSGYPGSPQINLAFEQGEVDASALTETALNLRADWVKPGGIAVKLLEFGTAHGDGIPLGSEFTPPPDRAAIYKLINKALGLPFGTYAGPPGMSDEALQVLRKAFAEMTVDKQFLEAAHKVGIDVDAVSGDKLQSLFTDFLNAPAGAKKEFASYVTAE